MPALEITDSSNVELDKVELKARELAVEEMEVTGLDAVSSLVKANLQS